MCLNEHQLNVSDLNWSADNTELLSGTSSSLVQSGFYLQCHYPRSHLLYSPCFVLYVFLAGFFLSSSHYFLPSLLSPLSPPHLLLAPPLSSFSSLPSPGGFDHSVKLWDVVKGGRLVSSYDTLGFVQAVMFAPNGKLSSLLSSLSSLASLFSSLLSSLSLLALLCLSV